MFNIVSAWGAQTNPHYDPDTANNGGGYWQFSGGIVVDLNGQLVTVEVDDTSCGDFGSRVYFSGSFPTAQWTMRPLTPRRMSWAFCGQSPAFWAWTPKR